MAKYPSNKAGGESGFVLVVCLILLLMLSLIGIASITTSTSDMRVSGNEINQTGAFYAAESGLERAAASLINSYQTTGDPPDPLPSGSVSENGYRYDYSTTDHGAATQQTLEDGAYRGLYGLVKSFTINSTGIDLDGESKVRLSMDIQDALIPIYQFAVFYQNDLEISPIGAMTLGGRVHSNGNVYIQSNSGISLISFLTAAGNIYHGPKAGSGLSIANGDVLIQDKLDTYQSMRNSNNSWLDSRSSDWVSSSIMRWGGMIEDDNHGITQLNMPVVSSGPATNLIDREGMGNPDSYENIAGLKLIDGQVLWLRNDNTWDNVTTTFGPLGLGIISDSTFYDSREHIYVHSINIDISKLNTSTYFPDNGVIYCSEPAFGGITAFRLLNGEMIKGPMTFATQNPLYIKGNFNINTKKPVALLADAITVLSGNWADVNSDHNLNQRVATSTQINASYITGSTETGMSGHSYNGGYENLLRLMEKWNGATLTWTGAAACMWYSRQATEPWLDNYYSSPTRAWTFDADLLSVANLPPGTPMIHVVQRSQWVQHFD